MCVSRVFGNEENSVKCSHFELHFHYLALSLPLSLSLPYERTQYGLPVGWEEGGGEVWRPAYSALVEFLIAQTRPNCLIILLIPWLDPLTSFS